MPSDKERLDWLDRNVFHREKEEWDARMYPDSLMWVLFAPKGAQGSARTIIDAAIAADKVFQALRTDGVNQPDGAKR